MSNDMAVSDLAAATATKINCCFKSSDTGEILNNLVFELSHDTAVNALETFCNKLLNKEDEAVPLAFYINDVEVVGTLHEHIDPNYNVDRGLIDIVYQQQAVFKVRAVTRCTGSLEGC